MKDHDELINDLYPPSRSGGGIGEDALVRMARRARARRRRGRAVAGGALAAGLFAAVLLSGPREERVAPATAEIRIEERDEDRVEKVSDEELLNLLGANTILVDHGSHQQLIIFEPEVDARF